MYFSVPTGSPINVLGHNTSSTSILVQWGNVPESQRNGIIVNYIVTYQVSSEGDEQTKVVNATTTQVTLMGLNEYTVYSIRLSASTSKGVGPKSEAKKVRTDQDSKYS